MTNKYPLDKKLLSQKVKYPPEMVAKWVRMLDRGEISRIGIQERYGISKDQLGAKLREYENAAC